MGNCIGKACINSNLSNNELILSEFRSKDSKKVQDDNESIHDERVYDEPDSERFDDDSTAYKGPTTKLQFSDML